MTKQRVAVLICLAFLVTAAVGWAQESTVKGNLSGTVYDQTGAVVPGAKITISGAAGAKSLDSGSEGIFQFQLLTPGLYNVKVEAKGFRAAEVKDVEVFTGRTTSIRVNLEVGQASETVQVTAGAVTVDTASTAVGDNLSSSFYAQIPVARNVASLFQLSPGVVSGGGTGTANPSISGGSGLENQYIADGVNITDSGYGGLGVFSRNYGALGTGINLTFIQEVQVKTGGFEAQYGKSTGGVVQMITKSGGSAYHGGISAYAAPSQFEATRLQSDDFGRVNQNGKVLHIGNYDVSGEFGGYVPGLKDRLFFFGSFNPALAQTYVLPGSKSPLFSHGEFNERTATYSYAGKLTYKINDRHSLESSGFGDPSYTSLAPRGTYNPTNSSTFSKFSFGTANWVFRYNGTLSPTWLVNASVTYGHNTFTESGFANVFQVDDRTQTAGLPGQRGQFIAQGQGFVENYAANNYAFNVDTQKSANFLGTHTLSLGYRYERPFYDDNKFRSGGYFPIPATNATGASATTLGVPASVIGQMTNAQFRLRLASSSCTLCPVLTIPGFSTPQAVYLQTIRGEFGPPTVSPQGTYHAAYVNDSWSLNKNISLNLGLRWEEQQLVGDALNYTFTDNWSPRIGISYDPWGNRKSKFYANFARYDFAIPLDAAIRSLSSELDFQNANFAPAFTTNAQGVRVATIGPFGTVVPVPDAAHLLNRATGGQGQGIAISSQANLEAVAPGTKMQYVDEYVVGFEREFKGGYVLSARYMDRRFGRIVEDTGGISPEASLAGVNQIFLIANPGPGTDIFTNPIGHTFTPGGTPPKACDQNLVADPVQDTFGNTLGAICYETNGKNGQAAGSAVADGVPDGFPAAVRKYQAVEIELNKAFSKNWQMRANWRIAKLQGNYEGAFRNDNGQTDPSISSLYDFTAGQFGLLGDQFKPGVLNTDRRHVVNGYVSYVFDKTKVKGLVLGTGVRIDSGIPINDLKAHPVYGNQGEVPVNGRGSLGRLPVTGSVDVHLEYPWKFTERQTLNFGADLFNIADARRQTRIDQNEDSQFGVANVDFLKPLSGTQIFAFQRPFYARLSLRYTF